MLLDDRQIEHYSRQIVLAEIGALGQVRLLGARVAITGGGVAAEQVLGYLAAAGVGTIAAPAALHSVVDPAAPDLTLLELEGLSAPAQASRESAAPFDAAIAVGTAAGSLPAARRRFWIAGGRAGETPPCSTCAAAPGAVSPPHLQSLLSLREALLGTVVATEVVKAIVGIGVGLRGRVLAFDPDAATVMAVPLMARPSCETCRDAGASD